uniref:WD repeat and FYVE domain-containing protein 3 n=1 Tax=Macrostomum lignano TaxID=282301 RepID=A0A1I8IRL4_9PLAT
MNELSSITKLIKTCNSARCKIIALQSLLKIAKCHEVLKDAYMSVGLLDLLVACLHAYAHQLKESSELLVQQQPTVSRACTNMLAEQRELGALVMQLLAFLLTTSVKNASVFRDAGGARCAHNMVPHDECRTDILGVVQQLVLSTASEDDMGCLLGLMHTAPPTAIRLKTEVLATISAVLQASHRCRSAFRRCSGFVYVISLLVSLEGSLKEQPGPPWDTADSSAVVLLLKTIFVTLTVAMKFEPANARFFKYEIRYDSLTEAVRLLGCFGPHADALPVPTASAAAGAEAGASSGSSSQPPTPDPSSSTPGSLRFDRVFQSAPVDEALVADYCSDLPQRLRCASFMLKCLFELGVESLEFGIDGGRGGVGSESYNTVMVASPEHSRHRKHLHNLTNQSPPPPAIVHPGAVLSFLQLIPAVVIGDEQTQPELDLQVSALNLLRSLMALARNVQTMCSFGMTQHLLRHYRHCLTDESHHLQPCIQSLFERLASHALSPNDLREFLRLGNPLCCRPLDEIAPSDTAALSEADVPAELPVVGHGGSVPLSRVKCLVSMATPRDARVPFSEPPPPFVELDMSAEGFACLYMPSLAPQAPPASSISPMAAGEAAASTLGGVGSGCDRLFPPPAGLTYMCWLSVQKTDGAVGGHPFRLFTVVRSIQSREDQLACLRVELDPTARQLTVSTAEAELGASPSAAHSSSSADAVFNVPQLSEPDTWHHLALVLNRSGMMKHSAVKLFIDAQLLGNQKLNYISPNVGTVSGTFGGVGGGGGGGPSGGSGGGSGAPISVASVCAYVGTPCLDSMRKLAPTAWFQGPLFLVEEPLSNQMIETVYKLGASYIGNFQSIRPDMECLFSEERIALSVFANSENVLTVSRIRKLFNRADAKSIAKLLVTAVNDNCTPIRLLPNAAVHLNGPARSMGAVLLGYQGIRSFSPQPVTAVLDCVGCTTVLLGLVSMATDADCLYAAVKALVCALRSSREAQKEMVRTNGFALLGMLLKRKRPLLNSRIQSYAFTLAGLGGVCVVGRSNSESGSSGGSSQLANQSSAGSTSSSTGEAWERNQQDALRYLVCDLRNWRSEASLEPVRTLLDGLTDLANESAGAKQSMLALDLVFRLLHFLVTAPNASPDLLDSLKLLVVNLLRPAPRPNDLLTLGQFLAVSPKYAMSFGLQVMIHLVSGNQKMSEAVSRILGFDWTFVFLQRGLPSDIVIQAFRLLLLLLVQPPGAVARFRDGQCARGWLAGVSAMRQARHGLLLEGFQSNSNSGAGGGGGGGTGSGGGGSGGGGNISGGGSFDHHHQSGAIANADFSSRPGGPFSVLRYFLCGHACTGQLYPMLFCLLLGRPPLGKLPPANQCVARGTLLSLVEPACQPVPGGGKRPDLCPEAAQLLLSMVRCLLSLSEPDYSQRDCRDWPASIIEALNYLYIHHPDFPSLVMSPEFALYLAECLFPAVGWMSPQQQKQQLQQQQRTPIPQLIVVECCGSSAAAESAAATNDDDNFKPFADSDDSMVFVRSALPDCLPQQQQQQQQSPPPPQSPLVTHPNVGRVIDFLRLIITDSFAFSLNSHSRGGSGGQPLIDVLLEACPDASPAAREKYQSLLLHSIIDHMLAFDILRAEEMSFPLNSGGSYACLAHNACYFAARVVDKLCAGLFANDSNEVYQFVRRLIRQAEQSPPPGGLDPLYNCLNRVLLYQLSRNIEDEREHPAVLEALNCLLRDAATILSPKNTSETFPSCLAYLLLTIVRGLPPVADSCQSSNWHVSSFHLQGQAPPTYAAVVVAAHKAWEELYLRRKVELQDSLRQPLNAPGTMTAPQLSGLNDIVYVAAKSRWVAYREAESSSVTVYRPLEKIHQQIRSNLSRMGSGMLRQLTQTASGQRRSRRDTGEGGGGGSSGGGGLPMSTSSGSGSGDFLSDHHHHHHHRSSSDAFDPSEAACLLKEQLASVKELVDQRCLQYEQTASLVQRYLEDEWASLEEELTRERGIWGPPRGFATEKWMLDATEGPLRMRKRLTPNPAFFQHYPFRSKSDSQRPAPRYRTPVSRDALLHVYSYRPKRLLIDQTLRLPAVQPDEVTEEGFVELSAEISAETTACINTIRRNTGASIDVEAAAAAAAADDTASSVPASDAPEPEGSSGAGSTAAAAGSAAAAASASGAGRDEESPMDSHAAIQHLLSGEKITQMFRCARVQGLDVHEGLLLLGKDYFYVVDGFTLFKTKEIVDIDAVPHHEPIIPSAPAGPQTNPAGHKREHFKFAYEDLREIHRRRYLLQPIALELFSSDGRTLLLVFRKRTMSKVYQKLEQMAPALSELSQQHQRSAEQNASASFITALMGEKSFTQRWERGEISNFQYLILLNTLAGRSYNDLMQYPIFPWILADYDSSELDLGNPDTFRDLTKPMGAQTEDRLTQFHKRFKEWDDPSGETPPYHYGTHYSSAMIVSSYLVRMEPFTQHFLKLQGGHFDLADRMFHSIREAWLSASKYNMADVKELIPEFFYLPQFLVNHNKFDLGTKQSGVSLNDVVLPPWAKDDSREFIRAHREALECDYVSSQLHNWIDLIFGYKQLGPSAVQSVNVFHHLFYEGNVDIDGIDDELKRTAVIGFINNFGQIPKQLFRKPHPAGGWPFRGLRLARPPIRFSRPPAWRTGCSTIIWTRSGQLKEAVGEILATDRSVAALPTNQCFVMPQGLRYLSWGHADNSLRLGVVDSDRIVATFEGVESVGCILCAVAPSDRMFVTGGTSTVVRVWQQFGRRLRLKAALYGHTEPVTCLAVSIAYSVIVSGSRDQSAIVWDLSRLCFVRQLAGHPAPVAAVAINESSGDIATAAGTHLHLWSVNGEPLASINTTSGRAQQIHCLAMSCLHDWDPMNVVLTAGADGVVRMWTLEYVQTPVADQVSAGEASSSTAAAAVQQSRQPPPNSPTDDQWVGRSGKAFEDPRNLDSVSQASAEASPPPQQQQQQQKQRASSVASDQNDQDDRSSIDSGSVSASIQQPHKSSTSSQLRQGLRWTRQLLFKSKLTMHTAYERNDNSQPAGVTSLSISRDHRAVYIGDARGRVWTWSVPAEPLRGGLADNWIKDEGVAACAECGVKFSPTVRRHHCRNCG